MKTLFKIFTVAGLLQTSLGFSQEEPKQDSVKVNQLDNVLVDAVRAKDKNPITFTNVSKEEIAPRNLGQDIPVLLNYLPSMVTTTDAGAGIGYTYMRVRGADGSRINVTLNGIPFNDSESQGTFFVNLPDFASSLESIQLQRGVGTSTNGAGAFGASLNMQTKSYQGKAYAEISNSVGSFNSRKHTLAFGTGLHDNFEINARISNIHSDGFVERASSDMFGYFFNANYITDKTTIKAIVFGGKEKTYQAWYGLDAATLGALGLDPDKVDNDRTYNIAGIQMNAAGEITGYYDDETDNYQQNHFQLHWNQKLSESWQSNTALHYTIGQGYYKQYVDDYYYSNILFASDSQLSFLGLNDLVIDGNTVSSIDYIRKRWLKNDFFGATFNLNYKKNKSDILFGGAANRYLGRHFGEVVWSEYNAADRLIYYHNIGNKDDVNFFAKASQMFGKFNLFADMQYRMVFYQASSTKFNDVNDVFRFFNPKAGINYQLNSNNLVYIYFGVANKEPRRDDYENGSTKPERLLDYELGWKHSGKKASINANVFYMRYKDQLVMTGALNDVGAPIFTNSGDSYRLGLEVESTVKVTDKLIWRPNVALSQNKNIDFYFQRDGELKNLGNTNIAYSPNVVAGNAITYVPVKNLNVSLLTKFVSKQYMGNIDSENSTLDAYSFSDVNLTYQWNINKGIKSILFSGLVNNVFNQEFESNGYFYTYDDNWSNPPQVTTLEGAGYFPQAGINFLVGATLKF
ncbi:TonB-dependent receptor [Flavobacterium pedocola]